MMREMQLKELNKFIPQCMKLKIIFLIQQQNIQLENVLLWKDAGQDF